MKIFLVLCVLSTVALCSSTVTCPSIVGYVADPESSENYYMCLFYTPMQRSCGSGNVFDSISRDCLPKAGVRQEMPPIFTTRFPTMPPIVTTADPGATGTEDGTATDTTSGGTWRPTPSVVTTSTARPTPPLISDLPTPPVVTDSTARPTPPLISDGTTPFPTPPLVTFTTDEPITPSASTTDIPNPPVSTTDIPNPPVSTTPPVVPISTTSNTTPAVPISSTQSSTPVVPVSTTADPTPPVSSTVITTTQGPSCPVCPTPEIVCPATGIHRYVHPTYCHRFFLCIEGVFTEMNCQTGYIFDHNEMRCLANGVCHINGWLFG